MIKVICIKWGNKYSPDYVDKLFRGIQRNTSKEFSFVCYTDSWKGIREAIQIEPLPYSVGSWFNKIGLYNKELYLPDEQIFYFDLDTVIVGNLDKLFNYSGNFILLRDFYRKNGFGSGFMSWRPTPVNFMWQNYRGQKCMHGDQGWCEEQYPTADIWQELYPKKVISYKVHIKDKGKLRNPNYTNYTGNLNTASVVCFHGKPDPHEIDEEWIKENWT